MSALSKLVGKPKPWDWFSAKYPVKVKQVNPPQVLPKQLKKIFLKRAMRYKDAQLLNV